MLKPFDLKFRQRLSGELYSLNRATFEKQFLDIVKSASAINGIVYVWNSTDPICRLKGSSTVIYIGKAKGSLYERYPKNIVRKDTQTFWLRYEHIISNYGPISIDIYPTNNPEISENEFLYNYHNRYLEAPPLNTQNYKESLLITKEHDDQVV